jgi:hypothetical protein
MARPPQQGVQPRHQLAQIEGLGQVVVGARLQPRDPVIHRVARRKHADRDVVTQRPQGGDYRDPVEFRHLDIQHQRVMRLVGQQPQRLFTVRRDPNVETRMPQSAGNGGSHVRVVVDHQHSAARALLRG